MDYKIYRSALTPQECSDYIAFGEAQYASVNPDQKYPIRGYPGFTLKNSQAIAAKLASFIDPSGFGVVYDFGAGTGVNYLNLQTGEGVGQHFDKPLYELDENYQIKPEYKNRACSVSVLASIGGKNDFSVEGDNITLAVSDVLVIKGLTVHELKPVQSGVSYLLSGFFCTNV